MPYNDNFVIRPHSRKVFGLCRRSHSLTFVLALTLEQKRWLDDKYPAWVAAKYFNVLDVLMQNYFEWWLVDFPQSQYQDYTADCIKAVRRR